MKIYNIISHNKPKRLIKTVEGIINHIDIINIALICPVLIPNELHNEKINLFLMDSKTDAFKFLKSQNPEGITINTDDNVVCLVIVPVYNEEIKIKKCIESILNQTYKNIQIAIIDDCSTDKTIEAIKSYKDERIKIYRNYTNKGCYNSINVVLQNETDWDCFMIQGADDMMQTDRVEKQIISDGYMASICMYNHEGIDNVQSGVYGHSMLCYSKKVFETIGYFDNTRHTGDTEYWLRYFRKFGEKLLNRIPEELYLSYENNNGLTKKYKLFGEERKEYYNKFEQEHIEMNKNGNFYRDFIDKERIYIGIATIPEREESLKDTIDSIINQCDELHIYCNKWNNIPNFLINDKIVIYDSNKLESDDLGDVGKFYGLQNKIGYCFTIDDDLIYDKNYVTKMIKGLKKYNNPVTLHGKIFKEPPIESYHRGSIIINCRCQDIVENDIPIQIAGSGVLAWHSDMIDINIDDFYYKNMSDIFISIFMHKKGLMIWCLEHKARFIIESEKIDETKSIWTLNNMNDERQTKLINDNYKYFNLIVDNKEKNIIFAEEEPKIKQEINIKIQIIDDIMSKILTVKVIKDKDNGIKFAPIGNILHLEESTANVLISKGLVELIENKKPEPAKVEATTHLHQKEEPEKSEAKEDKQVSETKELKEHIETKEAITTLKRRRHPKTK
ncbi:MAG: glycosyltransferase family A protein [Sulfurimonas sp.]|jgi:hypothetical protein